MRVAVTGASGNSGRYVVQALLDSGHEPLAILRERSELPFDIKALRVSSIENLRSSAALSRCDAIVHLARQTQNARDDAMSIDIGGTRVLADLWERGPFIFASSQTVYGIPTEPLHEELGLKPSSWYDLAKIVNEYTILEASLLGIGKRSIALRPPLVFSTNECRNYGQWLQIVHDACALDKTFIFEDEATAAAAGSSYIGGKDFADAILRSLQATRSGTYNVASGYVTWVELLTRICEHYSRSPRIEYRKPAVARTTTEFRLPQSQSRLLTTKFENTFGTQPPERWEDLVDEYVGLEKELRQAALRR